MIGPENYATVSQTSKIASPRTKTYSKNRIELRNLQNLKKMLKSHVSFSVTKSSHLNEKASNVVLNIAGVEKISSVAVNAGNHSIRVLDERSVNDVGNLCPLWLVIL